MITDAMVGVLVSPIVAVSLALVAGVVFARVYQRDRARIRQLERGL